MREGRNNIEHRGNIQIIFNNYENLESKLGYSNVSFCLSSNQSRSFRTNVLCIKLATSNFWYRSRITSELWKKQATQCGWIIINIQVKCLQCFWGSVNRYTRERERERERRSKRGKENQILAAHTLCNLRPNKSMSHPPPLPQSKLDNHACSLFTVKTSFVQRFQLEGHDAKWKRMSFKSFFCSSFNYFKNA
jgi:hypothetical protein